MKKVLSLLAVAGVFTFASCEKKTVEASETTTETTVEAAAPAETTVAPADSAAAAMPADTTAATPAAPVH